MNTYPLAESNKSLQIIRTGREGEGLWLLCAASVRLFASNQIQTTLLELLSVIEAAYNRGCSRAERGGPPPKQQSSKGRKMGGKIKRLYEQN